eukprot:2783431-Lingulodinium_polyedra.AAC.1
MALRAGSAAFRCQAARTAAPSAPPCVGRRRHRGPSHSPSLFPFCRTGGRAFAGMCVDTNWWQ